jgi:hypothetical protein
MKYQTAYTELWAFVFLHFTYVSFCHGDAGDSYGY